MKIISIPSLDDIPEGAEFLVMVPDDKPTPPTPPPGPTTFVWVQDEQFKYNGNTLSFAGTNAYYLPTYENQNQKFCDQTWNLFADSGVNLVRTWGFYDGPPQYSGDPSFQRFEDGRPVYDDEGLKCLDRTVAKAADRGIFLILALTNYHPELGGYREYCKATAKAESFDVFMADAAPRTLFKSYIRMLLTRVNTVTGRQYKDEPAILGWEICNEARNPGHKPEPLRNWYQHMAEFIKSIDPNHLVATGEDGFEDASTGSWGTDGKIRNDRYTVSDYNNTYVIRADAGTSYLLNTEIPEIDFGSFHWYPSDFGFGYAVNAELLRAQEAWIKDHARIASLSGKPAVLGEYGFHINWMPEFEVYTRLWRSAEDVLEGTLLWQLVTTGAKRNEYGGNIAPDRGPYNELMDHFNAMLNG